MAQDTCNATYFSGSRSGSYLANPYHKIAHTIMKFQTLALY